MNSFKSITLALAVASLTSTACYAQFGGLGSALGAARDKIAGGTNQTEQTDTNLGEAAAELSGDVAATDMVAAYTASNIHLIDAHESFATALGISADVTNLKAQKTQLESGKTDRDTLATIREQSDATNERIKEVAGQAITLDDQAKQDFATGLVSYFQAIAEARSVVLAAKNTGTSVATGGLMGAASQLGTAGVNLYIAKESPGYLSKLMGTGGMLLEFANRNNIPAPADATARLGTL
jgi:hypothetical protein